jgi:hypothetical protein
MRLSLNLVLAMLLLSGLPLFSFSNNGLFGPAAADTNITDFNGDGYEDLAIGVQDEDIGSATDAGAVNIIYGSSNGLSAAAVNAANGHDDQLWTLDSPGVEGSADGGESFGYSVATGHFNGDMFSDLAIGAPGDSTLGPGGSVIVIYGSSGGLSATAAGQGDGRADQLWSQNSPSIQDTAEGIDAFGSTLVAGDFNGDGFDDLAIASINESVGTASETGAVNVIYGSESGLSASAAVPDQFWHQNSANIGGIAESSDRFGAALATGDFNSDDFADLAVGVPFEGPGSSSESHGAVNVIYGSSAGLSAAARGDGTGRADQAWSQDSSGIEGSGDAGDKFGAAVAAGDFNHDTFWDLAIGVKGDSVGGIGGGSVSVIYGSSNGLSAAPVGASGRIDQLWWQNMAGVEEASEVSDGYGSALVVGNFNDDIYDDLAIGIPGESVGSVDFAGAVSVIYGASSGLSATGVSGTGRSDQFWSQNSPGVNDSCEAGELAGFALAAADFDDDGSDDLVISTYQEDVTVVFPPSSVEDAGQLNVIYGSNTGLSATAAGAGNGHDDQIWSQDTLGIEDSAEPSDLFGWSLAPPGTTAFPL